MNAAEPSAQPGRGRTGPIYRVFQSALWLLARLLIRLRYRVKVTGLEKLRGLSGPTLVMPNHPGYIDPLLMLAHVRWDGTLRPVVHAGMYRNLLLYPVMRLIHALEVPDLEEHSGAAHQRTLAMIDAIVDGLSRGDKFLIYPSGRLQRRGSEVVGAARAACEILARAPQANVVLVRTRGVWGSMFTFAQTGKLPNLNRCMLWALGSLASNLLFFAPRRKIDVTVEVIPRDQLPQGRDPLNRFLEAWYNQLGPETPTYVPYHLLFGRRTFDYPDLAGRMEIDFDRIRPQTRQAVTELIEAHLGRKLEEEEQNPDLTLDLLGLDSLERMDLGLEIEDRFGFRSDRVAATVGELWALAEGMKIGDREEAASIPAVWTKRIPAREPAEVLSETLAEAFVRRALAHPSDVALADPLAGVLTYRRLLVGASVMSKRFALLPGDNVGVLLPASAAAGMSFFGLHLAGKLPVMLNWTTGPGNLAHAVRMLGIQRVVTSRRFIDRLRIQIDGVELVCLEDLRAGMKKRELAKTLAVARLAPRRFLRKIPTQRPDDPAVVLFTSGSENLPKAVPLTHRNLVTNTRAALAALSMARDDVLLGALPPFHSFGLLGNLVAPAVSGFRVVYHPDPTDARGLVRQAAGYRTTLMITTPTFLGYILATASREELSSLRIIVTGAEKCPEALFHRAAELAPAATLLEGYGITECSPVVSANRLGRTKLGTVGLPVDHVEICVAHPDTFKPVPDGETGMLLVSGPSVFGGYMHFDGPDPFVELAGKRWYKTGDLVALDEQGFIHFHGRLKRFIKAGGEMISLPALEEPLTRQFPPTEDGPQVAVEGVETPDGRHIVLFTTREIPVRDANRILSEAGFRGVMRLDESRTIAAIPVLGTGKTDYKALRAEVLSSLAAPEPTATEAS